MKKLLLVGFIGMLLAGASCHGSIFKKMVWKPFLKDNTSSNDNSLLNAAARGNVKDIKATLDAGADVNALDREHGKSALMHAAANGHNEAVVMLIKAGAKVNAIVWIGLKNIEGFRQKVSYSKMPESCPFTALSVARKNNHSAVVKTLIEAGAVDTKTGWDWIRDASLEL